MVAFQNNNVLIERVGDQVKVNYKSGDKGTAKRTAIGQRADGSVILLVTDGRTASSLGATPNDVISVMLENKGEYPTWPEGWNGACEVVWIEEIPADTELGGGEKDSESDSEQDGEAE
jgi:hypothetical protein